MTTGPIRCLIGRVGHYEASSRPLLRSTIPPKSTISEHCTRPLSQSARRNFFPSRRALACKPTSPCSKKPESPPQPTSLAFWTSRPTWKRASVNTLRCLIGCTLGDFSALWFLQSFYPDLGVGAIMATSMTAGVTSSMLLETALLRLGRDNLSWPAAAKTAAGMSLISMLTMEAAQNAVDYHLTGGAVALADPWFWGAAATSVGVGFLAPLPYNYVRLRKYGKACH